MGEQELSRVEQEFRTHLRGAGGLEGTKRHVIRGSVVALEGIIHSTLKRRVIGMRKEMMASSRY
jgi:hypothetical protein